MSIAFEIEAKDSVTVFQLSGRLISHESIQELIGNAEKNLNATKNSIICDCSKLEYCNSSGLNLFVRLLTKTRNVGGDCIIVGMNGSVQKLFELSKLNQIFTLVASEEEALARLNQK
jgi:anti-sigma B factor antagonist